MGEPYGFFSFFFFLFVRSGCSLLFRLIFTINWYVFDIIKLLRETNTIANVNGAWSMIEIAHSSFQLFLIELSLMILTPCHLKYVNSAITLCYRQMFHKCDRNNDNRIKKWIGMKSNQIIKLIILFRWWSLYSLWSFVW